MVNVRRTNPRTIGAGNGQEMIADSLGLAKVWHRQNTERLSDYSANPGFYTTAYTRRLGIFSYVLEPIGSKCACIDLCPKQAMPY